MDRSTGGIIGRLACAAAIAITMGGGCAGDDTGAGSGGGSGGGGGVVDPPPLGATPLVDTSSPDRIVGSGTPESCTAAALTEAVTAGGVIVFDCGSGDHTIAMDGALELVETSPDVVLDGEGSITLDGGDSDRIIHLAGNFESDAPSITVQRLSFVNGRANGSGDTVQDGGGAIFREGGSLTVIQSVFADNRCPTTGQDVAGGAIYSLGGGETTIASSRFSNNRCSSGGALGHLGSDLILLDSELVGNAATGMGGNPGNGGNGGGVYMDGRGRIMEIRDTVIATNTANARGGGVFRVSYEFEETLIDRSTIDGNTIPINSDSQAGGLYLQGTHVQITSSTISRNQASGAGGIFVAEHAGFSAGRLDITNSTIADNEALDSLGGGIVVTGNVDGTLWNVTIAGNAASDDDSFAGGIVGEGLALRNVLLAGNQAGNGWNPITCTETHDDLGGNVQHPVERIGDGSGGGSDDPDALCASGALTQDPMLGPLADNGGATETMMPSASSVADGLGSECPPTDQRGEERGSPCTSGAVELP